MTKKEREELENEELCVVAWTALDVKEMRPSWSLRKCHDFLCDNQGKIKDRLMEEGRQVLKSFLP